MASERPDDWMDRLTRSLQDHESERGKLGSEMPRYEILNELGRGGMGIVYRAWDPQLGREVALKLLLERADNSADARERFLREAQLASRLSHPNIVAVHDTGEWMGQTYLAMQLVVGTTIEKAGLGLRAQLGALRDAARALDYAHREGIVHRDVKPANLMVDADGRVYVTDFGLARRTDVSSRMTVTGVMMGTPSFMPPEQALGKPADARSDVYALGATMYDLMSGRPPFTGTDALKVMKQVSEDDPPPPRQHRPDLPSAVEKIILKAMEKDPAHRYPTAGELADDIQRYLDGEPITARPAPLRFRTSRLVSRHRWPVVVAAILVFGALAHWLGDRIREQAQFKTYLDLIISRVRGDDWAGADRVSAEMTEWAPDHDLTREATKFLREAKAARDRALSLRDSVTAKIDNGKLKAAWKEIQELDVLKFPAIPVKGGSADWYQELSRIRERLMNLLVEQLELRATEEETTRGPEALGSVLMLAGRVDPGLVRRLVPLLPERARLWAGVKGPEASAGELRDVLMDLESKVDDAWTLDLAARLRARLEKDRQSLPEAVRIELAWKDCEAAFREDSPTMLRIALEMLSADTPTETEGKRLSGVQDWWNRIRRAEEELDHVLKNAKALADELKVDDLPARLRESARKRLASLRKELALRRTP